MLFATLAAAALPGFPTPDYILPTAPFFSVDHDTIACTDGPLPPSAPPTDGVHQRGMPLSHLQHSNELCVTATPQHRMMLGDVNGSNTVDGDDIAGFVRVILNASIAGDNAACAEYCLGSIAANTDAFANALVN